MKKLIPCLALAAATGTAQAEVAIQSGEHDTFSRLVLTVPASTTWEMNTSEREVRIQLSDRTQRFDTSTIFDFIPQNRLVAAKDVGSGALELTLNCACEVDAFRFGEQYLVLDIEDGSEPERPKSRQPVLPVILQSQTSGPVPPLGFQTDPEPSENVAESQPTFSDAREQLLNELGRAASQGLVTAKPIAQPEPKVETAQEKGAQDMPPSSQVLPEQLSSNINLHAETSLDTALSGAFARALPSGQGARCLSEEVLAVETWADDRDYQQQAGYLNRRLFREFDKIDEDAVMDLMRFYVNHGFGAEALFTARLLEKSDAETEIIKTMARIVDDLPMISTSAFSGQHDCDTPASMWAILADGTLDPSTEVNEIAVRRSFSALPVHLRQHLAPMLSRALREGGHSQLAEEILRTGNRGVSKPSADVRLAEAQLDIDQGAYATADATMTELVDEDAAPSPAALVELVDLRIANGDPIEVELATLAAAYAFQHAGTPLGHELKRAEILALADSGQFLAAMQQVDAFDLRFHEASFDAISKVMDLASEHATDEDFLRISVGFSGAQDSGLTPETSNRVAQRLLNLGVVDVVPSLLETGATGAVGRERRKLRARLAIMTARPRNAIAHLIGLDGKEVSTLRAEAFAALKEHDRAQSAFQTAGQSDRTLEQAILAKNWSFVSAQTGSALADFAASRAEGATNTKTPSLEAGVSLLAESRNTLDRVNELLDSFQVSAVLPEAEETE